MRSRVLTLFWLALGTASFAQDAPRELTITPEDAQNFAVTGTSTLRIVGDENLYDIILPADVLFDFDQSELRPDAEPLLALLKEHFATHRSDQVHVHGHTDNEGTDEYNLALSQKRAVTVCTWLKEEAGVDFTNCIGHGEAEPLVPNENADGSDNPVNRQLNRRVTVTVVAYPDTNQMLDDAQRQAQDALDSLPQ
jgi:outer membrane protein OmpA-like peptidoglycan-associated protein